MNRAALLSEGRRKAAILRAIDLEGPDCECGAPADEQHPPLPKPTPWGHGRPCSRESDLRRYAGTAPVEHRAARAWGLGS